MQAAVLSATTQLQLSSITSQDSASAFLAWLQKHGSRVIQRLELATTRASYAKVDLPYARLRGLQSLALDGVAVSAFYNVQAVVSSLEAQEVTQYVQTADCPAKMLAPMPALAAGAEAQPSATLTLGLLQGLTHLQLRSCSLHGCRDKLGWLSAQLAPLTQLQDLDLGAFDDGSSGTSSSSVYLPEAACSGLQTTLAQLTQLTHLQLALHYNTFVPGSLAVLSGLRQLQCLSLMNVGSALHPLQLEDIPPSLTHLVFCSCFISCPANPGGDFRLDALQELSLCSCYFTEASPPVWAFTRNLRQVYASVHNTYSADVFAALTASSNLSSLKVECSSFPAGAIQSVFTASRQLPWLQKMVINEESASRGWDGRMHSDDNAPIELDPGDLANLTACSPNLRELSFVWAGTNISCSELQLLQRLTALTSLDVGGPAWDDDTVEAVLAGMTGEALTYTCGMLYVCLGPGCIEVAGQTLITADLLDKICGHGIV
jgi:hypothetical protein